MSLSGKNILIGISGGIAAYKTLTLIRLLKQQQAEVKVVTSQNALNFVTELTLETLSQNKVYSSVFAAGNDHSTEHISLPDWADCLIVAPATADIIGKFANGIADDALSTTFLAFDKPIFIAPSMNVRMYNNAAVQNNMQKLQAAGVMLIDAEYGELACGTEGKGRMEEPEEIERRVDDFFAPKMLSGKKILITAGPTYEQIDPVRFIGNYSTGKMGFALAETCAKHGAEVTLIAGPVQLQTVHANIKRINVKSANEMYLATTKSFAHQDGAILCAAVADFTPETNVDHKMKRGKENWQLTLKPTHDIAAELGRSKTEQQFLVGFALETNNEETNALDKLARKNLDFIVLNSLRDKEAGFGYDTNKITIYGKDGSSEIFPLKSKIQVAEDIISKIIG